MAYYIIGGLVLVALIVILVRKASSGDTSSDSHHDEQMWTGHSDQVLEGESGTNDSNAGDSKTASARD
jgi:hypothetical protein